MWKLYLRNPNREREGEIDDFHTCEAIPRFNDIGTWSVTLDARAPLAAKLATEQYGIELVRDDTTTVITGPMRVRKIVQDGDKRQYTITGVDDMVWLKRRLAHPEPATAVPPYSTQEYDVRTGGVSQVLLDYVYVNAGPGALLPRRVPGLLVDYTSPPIFVAVTGRARWQNLLTMLQELAIAGGGCGFRVVKSGSNLQFQVYTPVDRTATVKLSCELGNLYGYQAEAEASEANYVYCGGGGEGTARTIREGQDGDELITWGRAETFQDRRDTTDTTELDQEITKTLTEGVGKTGLTVDPVDTDSMQFLRDYNLGDRVTYALDGLAYTEVVREAHIELTPDGPQKTYPTLQSAGRMDVLALFRRLREAEARIRNLERS